MPIDRHNNLLFIHIPKTAGTAIEELLGIRGPWQLENLHTCFGQIQSLPLRRQQFKSNYLQHLTLRELSTLLGDDLQGCTPFAVIRHPWTRLLSSFRRKDPDLCSLYRYHFHRDLESLNLTEYIEVASWLDHPHLRPQLHFLRGHDSDQPDRRLHLFHQENLAPLEEWLSTRTGKACRLERQNVTVTESPMPTLNPTTLLHLQRRVHEIYAVDMEAFGYTCRPNG